MTPDKAKKLLSFLQHKDLATFNELSSISESLSKAKEAFKGVNLGDIKSLKQLKGEPGYTPKKGQDYFTLQEIEQIKRAITPRKGIDYRDGQDASVDYELIVDRLLDLIPIPKDGRSPLHVGNEAPLNPQIGDIWHQP